MSDIQIVAEIGCNHNGSVELAKKMMKKGKQFVRKLGLV